MAKLPDFLEDFLCLGNAKITAKIKPNWLIDPFCATAWRIKIPGYSRFVDGKWLGSPKLDWKLQIPGGYLTDEKWHTLLQHSKLMVLAHIEGPNGNTRDPRALMGFQGKILTLAEHLIVHYPNEISLLGLASLSSEKVEQYLVDHLRYGSTGTGNWLPRWEHYLLSKIRDPKVQNNINKQINEYPSRIIKNIDNIKRSILTNDPLEIKSMPEINFSPTELKLARRWLLINKWYNKDGCVNLERLAKAIEVDFIRIAGSTPLKYYLRPLEQCQNYQQNESKLSFKEFLSHRYSSTAQITLANTSSVNQRHAYRFFEQLQLYSDNIDMLKGSILSSLDLTKIHTNLQGEESKRTPTLPVPTALYIYEHLIHWAQQYSKALMSYYSELLRFVINKQGHAIRHRSKKYNSSGTKIYPGIWEKAFVEIPPPVTLNELHLWRVTTIVSKKLEGCGVKIGNNGSKIPSILRSGGLTVIDAMRLNSAVLIALIAAFSLRRLNEIIPLKRNCLVKKEGRCYLGFNMEKVGCDGVRALAYRPIPQFLYNILQEQKRLANALALAEKKRKNDPLLHDRLFIIPTHTGGKTIHGSELNIYLDLFCDWIEVPLNLEKRRWYIRIHECRRFGAMSFFHLSGMGSSLPALSWFMGHQDIRHTWKYIQEELSGQELTQCEVAMAHAALLNQQNIANLSGSQKLERIILKHFGVNRLDLIDPNELDEYLEMLYIEGIYRVTPHTIQLKNKKHYTILIEITKGI